MDAEICLDNQQRDAEDHGTGTETDTTSSETDSQRAETPGPMPKYQYSKDDLVKLSLTAAAKKRPFYLARDFDTTEGFWDPERWVRSFDTSRGSSPTTFPTNRDRKRSLELDRDAYKRRPSDPKARLKEEDEDLGIVLSPQRGSFLTGCHVTKQVAPRRPNSPADQDRDGRDRREQSRRIGSGRIQIDRERERDRGDYREARGRYDGDDRSNFGRERLERGERSFRRDDGQHGRGYHDRRYGRYRREEEEPPEWFTGGPTSQHETIELHGFERDNNKSEDEEEEEVVVEQPKTVINVMKSNQKEGRHSSTGNSNVVDRNGSLETNESSSPEVSPPSDHRTHTPPSLAQAFAPDFDFNEFFKINIPGLHDGLICEPEGPTTGSRFSQWFNLNAGGHPEGHRSDSRRSSITEDFTFLAGQLESLVSGQKSPAVLSPPPDQQHRLFSPITTPEQKQQQNLLEMLHNAKINVQPLQSDGIHQPRAGYHLAPNNPGMPHGRLLASDVERDLKAILMNGTKASNNNQPDPTTMSHHQHGMSARNTGVPDGKVTTVAELEANLKEIVLSNNNKLSQPQKPQLVPPSQQQPNLLQQQQQQQQRLRQQEEDMAAFNKLLGMMKATGALQDTPKMPYLEKMMSVLSLQRKHDGRPVSPISVSTAQKDTISNQQKDVLQKLLQQQQQQLQQQARLKQQQQQQQQLQDQLMKFVKQNPTIVTKPASPIPPQMAATLQPPPASPRCPSPALGLQPPASPHAPSPIMFGSQPPMHLTAPSPIHPGQLQPPQSTQNLSVNTLQVGQGTPPGRSPLLARVPSPQELIVHTQAIMQNALIKKQLEDQKERFMRKQQERAKSPNPMTCMQPGLGPQFPMAHALMTPVSKGTVTPAFTPTSVIRKMANDKAEEKEKEKDKLLTGIGGAMVNLDSPECHNSLLKSQENYGHPGTSGQNSNNDMLDLSLELEALGDVTDLPGLSISSETGTITLLVPTTLPNGPSHAPSQQREALAEGAAEQDQGGTENLVGSMLSPQSGEGSRIPRPLFGQGHMQTSTPSSTPYTSNPPTQAQPSQNNIQGISGRPIVKGSPGTLLSPPGSTPRPGAAGAAGPTPPKTDSLHRSIVGAQGGGLDVNKLLEQQRQQRTAAVSPASPNLGRAAGNVPYPMGVNSPMGMQPGVVRPGMGSVSPNANALLLQRMMHPGLSPSPNRGMQQVNSLSPMNQLSPLQLAALQAQAAQAQQRGMDPRLPGAAAAAGPVRGLFPPGAINPMVAAAAATSPQGTFQNNTLTAAAALNAAISRALSPQPQIPQPMISLAKHNVNGPLSPGAINRTNSASPNMAALLGSRQGMDTNLAKWFGSDMFKQQMPVMPPLPTQGQKVLTVDEIERRQQTVTH